MSRWRRTLAFLFYLKKPTLAFLPLFLLLVLVLILGGYCFSQLYQAEKLGFARALYITYALVFMEHLLPFPEHWALQLFYVLLPPLGLIVLLDGMVRFGYHILRRDAGGPEWNKAMINTLSRHVILCGLGKAGFRILQVLLQLGEQVSVLEKNPVCPNIAYARRQGVPVLVGSGRQVGMLEELGIEKAKSIILATDDDLANLELALDARKARPDIHVVLRVFDQELAAKVRDSLRIPLAFSTTALAAPLFATASSDPTIENAFMLGEKLLVVARLEVGEGSKLVGQTPAQLATEQQVFILSLERAGRSQLFPSPELSVEKGDVVVVQTEPEVLRGLHRLNRSGRAGT